MVQGEDEDFFYRPRAQGGRVDPAIGRMALGAGAVALVIIITAIAYSGFHAGNFGPPPIINPPDIPLRVAPQTPGGLVVPGADVPIMSGDMDNDSAPPQLAQQTQVPDVAQLDQAAGLNAPPPAAAAPSPATPAPVAAAQKTGPAQVQLAATPDEGGAEAAWAALQKQAPALLGSKTPIILPAVINGASVWRVRLSGFPTAAAAAAFCAQLTTTGASCAVAQ